MKFDAVVGNPPYQEGSGSTNFSSAIFHEFITAGQQISDLVSMICPARFLFNAGSTPKDWNKRMLNDPYLKVSLYEQDSSRLFPNTDIKGGVCIILWNKNAKDGGLNGVYVHIKELASIKNKVQTGGFDKIVSIKGQTKYTSEFAKSDSRIPERRIQSGAFDALPDIFVKTQDETHDIKIIGLEGSNNRTQRWVSRHIIEDDNLENWKVFLPAANGSGAIGEVLSTPLVGEPLVGEPLVGSTYTFLQVGRFKTENEAINCMKYIKSKFCRTMLGILKITQGNLPETWKLVPLQNFTPNSDIDWSKSIAEIDQQLYTKYHLDQTEIDFIETRVKEMS